MRERALLVAVVAGLVVSFAAPRAQEGVSQRIARIEAAILPGIVVKGDARPMAMADRMRFHHTPGVSVAVLNGGVIEWARGYGVLEAGRGEPVTPHTRFQAASISKPVAAMAALRLVRDGRLSLDEDVNAKLQSWKLPDNELTASEKVTLRRVLSHTAGLTVHGFPGYASTGPVPSLVQVLDGVKPANTGAIRVDVLPGSQWRYSGGGYTVLQQMLIDVSGRPFPDFMRSAVLDPLGMNDSTYEQPLPAALRPAAAAAHDSDGRPIAGHSHTYPEMAAAGLWTTPGDLARFAIEVRQALGGRSSVLSEAVAKEMLTAGKGDYGLGLSVTGAGPNKRFGHGGSNAGFRCQLLAYVESGHGAVVMTNADGGGRLASEILRTVAAEYGWPGYPKPKEKTLAIVDPAVLETYAGRYELRPGQMVTLGVKAGKLFLTDRDQVIELLPESAAKFFELTEETEVEFLKDADGKVTALLVNGQLKAPRRN